MKKYNGFLTSFEIKSDYEEDDVYSYINPVTYDRLQKKYGDPNLDSIYNGGCSNKDWKVYTS